MTTNDDAIALPCEQCEPTDKITLAEDLARQEKYDEAVDVLYPTVEPLEQLYKDCKDENLAQILARIYDLLADCFIPLIEHYWYKTYDATSEAERVLKRELQLRMDIGSAANHENLQFEAEVAYVSLRLAKFYSDPKLVEEFFCAGIGILEEIVEVDESYQDRLALAYYDLGAWYMVKQYDMTAAREAMMKAGELYRVLYDADPDTYSDMQECCAWAMFAINMALLDD